MRAVVIPRHGGPEVLEVQERRDPQVAPGEVRIAVEAAGINFADLLARTGMYPDAPKPPCVVGYEVAGTVESIGDGVDAVSVGDRVMAGTRFGGYAELCTVSERDVLPLPERLSFEQGAAVPVNYGTAYAGIVLMGGLREGDRVLIHAAAGGVGISATQIAAARGAEIFGTASAAKHDAIRAQGVTHAIDYRTVDFEEAVARLTGGEGIDIAFDAIGPTSFRKDYRLLRPGGRLVCYGLSEVQTGEGRNIPAVLKSLATMTTATMPWWKSMGIMNENKGVFGLNMLHWWDREGSLDRVVDPLGADLDAGRIDPVVAAAFRFDERPTPTATSMSAATSARSSSCRERSCRARKLRQLLHRARRRRRPAPRLHLPHLLPRDVRVHPDQRPHDPCPGELVAGQRRGRRDPHPSPRLGDPAADDHRLDRDRRRPGSARPRDRRRRLRDRHRAHARRVRSLAGAQGRLLVGGRAEVDRRRDRRGHHRQFRGPRFHDLGRCRR